MVRVDSSERTKMVRRYNNAFIIALLLMVLGLAGMFRGFGQYKNMVQSSSSPVGTTMHFQRSNADLSIAGLYTDDSNSVLIVRLTGDEGTLLKLPYKGSDYRVFLATNQYNTYAGQKISVLLGRYMTNGDMFLIIPKPVQDVYNIFIMNTNFIATDVLSGNFSGNSSVADVASLSEEQLEYTLMTSLNKYAYQDIRERDNAITVDSDVLDIIGFRATLKPALNSESYRVQVIPGTLLSETGEFDFEAFFNTVFKENVTTSIESDYQRTRNQEKLLQQRVEELEERLEASPNDDNVRSYLAGIQAELKSVQEQLATLAETYNRYETVTFSQNMFKDLQTEAVVLSTSQAAEL